MSRASEAVLLEDHLKELRLPAMRRDYAECARQARETRASYEGFLLDLVSRQLEQRRANQLERRLKQARFPVMKTLEKTDLGLWPTLDAVEVRELMECSWISERENVSLIGKHGTGKMHAATVLGVEACRRGHRVLFQSASSLVVEMIVNGRMNGGEFLEALHPPETEHGEVWSPERQV